MKTDIKKSRRGESVKKADKQRENRKKSGTAEPVSEAPGIPREESREKADTVSEAEKAVAAPKDAVSGAEKAVAASEEAVLEAERAVAAPEDAVSEAEKAVAAPEDAVSETEKAVAAPEDAISGAEKAAAEAEKAVAAPEDAVSEAEKAVAAPEDAASEAEKADFVAEAGEPGKAGGREGNGTEKNGDRGKKIKNRGISLTKPRKEDPEEEGEDWENDDLEEDWEEGSEPSKPWVMALVFAGMIVAAAAICVMLWNFTHPDKPEEDHNVSVGATAAPGSGDALSPTQRPDSGTGDQTPENQGGNTEPGSDPDETDTSSEGNRVTTLDGRVIIFTECDDMVTPKEYVNLRTEPSTAQGDATVGCMLNNGEIAHRTGISEEMGWSRLEYKDQVLYVVTSLVNVVTDEPSVEPTSP